MIFDRTDRLGTATLTVVHPFVLLLLCVILSPYALAQVSILSPEQQAMLNQLPPTQRKQALQAIEQLQNSSGSSSQQPSTLVEPRTPVYSSSKNGQTEQESREVPRAGPGSQLIIGLTRRADLSPSDEEGFALNPALLNVEGSNYQILNDSGELVLPGFDPIILSGLTEQEIEIRLNAVPEFQKFSVSANLLGEGVPNATELKPYGYDFFESAEATFDPVNTGPVPPDYVLGPGDSVRVQLFGNVNGIYEFEVSRDGELTLPELGPVTVAGLTFSEFRRDIANRVEEMLIGTQVSVTMGQLRSIRLFVLGYVNQPGSYVVGSLSTISSALYRSGGISQIGSLRNIQLKRRGELVATLDLYDLLLKGDSSADSRLQPGDVVFVPPIGAQVAIDGAVRRPGIYEIKTGTSFSQAIEFAGGLEADAYPAGSRVERVSEGNERRVLSINLTEREARQAAMTGGDSLTIPRALTEIQKTVVLSGHVQRPGPYQWREGMRLADLISAERELKAGADTDYVLIRRESPDSRRASALSASITAALNDPTSDANVLLQARDTVHVFSLASGRQRTIRSLLDELALQSRYNEPFRAVSVFGEVRAPGTYPLESRMRVSDLLRAGGGLSEDAYSLKAELARYEVVDGEYRDSEIIDVDLAGILGGTTSADMLLGPHDSLRISVVPEWDRLWSVAIEGEVRFPGQYRIRDGETLPELLERAGGLSEEAFPEGAIFLRESLREREQEQIDMLARRLEADLTALSLRNADTAGQQTLATGEELLNQLRDTKATGRLVIELDKLISGDGSNSEYIDLVLRDGDQLLVPKRAQEVTVIGEVQQSTSHLFRPGLSRSDYIDLSGGLTRRADKRLIYVVRANGAVEVDGSSRWFGRRDRLSMRPGDTIVVPLETDRIRPLTLWSSVTQILYQGAIAVAAVRTFND